MHGPKPTDILKAALQELRGRRDGCPDPTCSVCKQFKIDDAEADAALAKLVELEQRMEGLEK